MGNIYVIYIKVNYERFGPDICDRIIDILPSTLLEKRSTYLKWQDKANHLLGKLLMVKGIQTIGADKKFIAELRLTYNEFGRPFTNGVDFNVSHSGQYVLCAVSPILRIGVDVEEINKCIHLSDFTTVFTIEELRKIEQSDNPSYQLAKFWTMKESVIKADSRGLSIPLDKVIIDGNQAILGNKKWYLQELPLHDKNYCACLAWETEKSTPIKLVKMEIEELLLPMA